MRALILAAGFLGLSLCCGVQAGTPDEHASRDLARSAAASASAAAAEAEQAANTLRASTAEHCQGESAAAERIMRARQMGAAMATVMVTATKYGEPFVGYVQAAYEMPRLSTSEAQDDAIGDFRDRAYSNCLDRWSF